LFSAQQVNAIHDLLGLPLHGVTLAVTALFYYPYSQLEQWQPTWQHGDLTKLIADLHNGMLLCSQYQVDLIQEDLELWRRIRVSPMKIASAANQVTGNVVDHEEQRKLVRLRVANLLGVLIPAGGYLHEAEAVLGRSLSEFMSGSGGGRGFGDL
jgi:hypothetical protein